MNLASAAQITGLLDAWAGGDREAFGRLSPLVYEELRRMARRYMRDQAGGNTLQPTAVVNEAFLRLLDVKALSWQSRVHFFAVSANIMRRILVDAARARRADKRGGGMAKVNWNETLDGILERTGELVALDEALAALEKVDERNAWWR